MRSLRLLAMNARRRVKVCAAWSALALLGCEGPLSTLTPAGQGAERIARMFWWMAGGTIVIWLAVVGLAVYAVFVAPKRHAGKAARRLIVVGGVAVPVVVLTGLLIYGLASLPPLMAPAPDGSLTVLVTGEQWWWRVRYRVPGHDPVELANEIVVPVGEPVEFHLDSHDVIHSFWIPSLGGKVDMIPGHRTRLTLEPTEIGVFRGVCAEYCGTSHAWMGFSVMVLAQEHFAHWLARQAEPARSPSEPLAIRGQESFIVNGCGACHTIRGTAAQGVVGPDLTHVGSRNTLAAGLLDNSPNAFWRWIAYTNELKPGVYMPAFGMLPSDDLQALAAYLESLQ